MGYAVALTALARGANVTVVTGPAEVAPPGGCNVIHIETAQQMADEVATLSPTADVIIGVAAVADYRIAKPATEKRKRVGSPLTLDLLENPDIIAGVGRNKRPGQIVVGFAAETSAPAVEAARKCADKNLDLVIGNLVGVADSGFGAETSRAWFVYPDGTVEEKALQDKTELAADLMDRVVAMLKGDLRS
jgi:phosphopantothenoylcysteine decarboxylase/phosphopantothenate--cysteine ligase